MLQILSFTQNNPRKIFIAYDQLINNPRQECTRLCNFLDENCGKSSQDSDKRLEAMLPQSREKPTTSILPKIPGRDATGYQRATRAL